MSRLNSERLIVGPISFTGFHFDGWGKSEIVLFSRLGQTPKTNLVHFLVVLEVRCINHKHWVASGIAIIKKDDTDYNNVDKNKRLVSIYKQHDNVSYL